MSDDDNRRGPRGPRKPGGGGRSGGPGGRSGGFDGGRPGSGEGRGRPSGNDGERPARAGGFKGGGFKPAGSSGRSGGFRDAPAAGDGPARERFERPRRAEDGGQRPFKPRFPREDGARRAERSERPGRGERPAERSGEGFRPRGPRRDADDGAPRRFRSDGPPARAEARPHHGQGDDRPQRGPREDRRDDRPQRRDVDAPRSSSRPERRPFLPRGGNPERLASPEKAGGVERIAKVIARAGAASRREAEEMIEQGRVTVDGECIASPALDVLPTARITIDGEALPARERTRLWLYHKPPGLVSTNHDPEGRTTLFEALPEDLPRVITVGRLDINTEGLLLFTNSGELANQLMHPRFGLEREYAVRVLGALSKDEKQKLLDGVMLEDGLAQFGSIEDGGGEGSNCWYRVTISEGRNREVRRMMEAVGHAVSRLIRIRYGAMVLPHGLRRGAWLELDEADIRALMRAAGASERARPASASPSRNPSPDRRPRTGGQGRAGTALPRAKPAPKTHQAAVGSGQPSAPQTSPQEKKFIGAESFNRLKKAQGGPGRGGRGSGGRQR